MKSAIRAFTAFSLTLVCGVGLGIGLQTYFKLSDRVASLPANPLWELELDDAVDTPITTASGDRPNSSTVPEQIQGKLKLYVLVGQSNMVGSADIPDDLAHSANVYTFGNDYRWTAAKEPIDSPENQVDSISKDSRTGFGPALTFAQTLVARDSNQLIGLIPCAKEGSSITDWQQSLSDNTLYGSCLKRVRAATTMGTVSGILFFQGEADTIDPKQFPALQPEAETWAEKFALFAYSFRQDIGNPGLPLVYAQLGQPDDLEGLPNWSLVQQQQNNIQIPNAVMIETKDLPMKGIHYTADSYKVIGQRFADAMTTVGENSQVSFNDFKGESSLGESVQ